MSYPPCFPSVASYIAWVNVAKRTLVPSRITDVTHCLDCLPGYQAAMIAKGLCGHPDVVFTRDADGFMEGRYRRKPQQKGASA